MAQIYNTKLISELKEGAKLQQLRDIIPSQLAEKVVPVMEVNPKLLRRTNILRSSSRSTTTNGLTIYTTPTNQDFYLTYAQLNYMTDAAADNTTLRLTCTIDGATRDILTVCKQTLTATSGNIILPLQYPIKIDRGTNIQLVMAFTVGASIAYPVIGGYVDETSLA